MSRSFRRADEGSDLDQFATRKGNILKRRRSRFAKSTRLMLAARADTCLLSVFEVHSLGKEMLQRGKPASV